MTPSAMASNLLFYRILGLTAEGYVMEFRRYKDILAARTTTGEVLGFHAHNLEVAELNERVWNVMASQATLQQNQDILQELEEWQNEINPDASDEQSESSVRVLLLNIAQICNLKCSYCAAGGDGTYGSDVAKIDTGKAEEQIRFFIGSVENGESFHIEFCGGEPLLYPNVIESLCRYARLFAAGRQIAVTFSINTNGTLITSGIADMFARYQFRVTISLDGDASTNDSTRPAKKKGVSSTELTLAGLAQLRPVRRELNSLIVNCVFGSHNSRVEKAYDFLSSLGLDWDLYNFNFANNDKETTPQATEQYLKELKTVAEKVFQLNGIDGLAKIAQFRRPLARLLTQVRQHNYCGAGKALVQADTRADLYVCNWFMNDGEEKIGHRTEISQKALRHYSSSLIQLNKCETCWARHLCGGGCMAVHKSYSGNRHEKDPNFCYRTREIAAEAIRYFKQSLTQHRLSPTN